MFSNRMGVIIILLKRIGLMIESQLLGIQMSQIECSEEMIPLFKLINRFTKENLLENSLGLIIIPADSITIHIILSQFELSL